MNVKQLCHQHNRDINKWFQVNSFDKNIHMYLLNNLSLAHARQLRILVDLLSQSPYRSVSERRKNGNITINIIMSVMIFQNVTFVQLD